MELLLEIYLLRPGLYAYSIHMDAPVHARSPHYESAFDSLAACLRDAGDSLGHYFPTVHMHFNGHWLGQWSTASLRYHAETMAREVLGHVAHCSGYRRGAEPARLCRPAKPGRTRVSTSAWRGGSSQATLMMAPMPSQNG